MGKPAALLVPSGTMANQIALRLLGQPGTAVVVGRSPAHRRVRRRRGGDERVDPMASRRRFARHAPGRRGAVGRGRGRAPSTPDERGVRREHAHGELGDALVARGPRGHLPRSVCRCTSTARACSTRKSRTGVAASAYAAAATTVMCCLSKGLGAPIGSLLAGPADLIARRGESASGSAAACARPASSPRPVSSR